MDETEKLSALIGSIYDTSLDPSLWPAVLKESARFACGWSGALFAKDAASKAGEIYYNDGVIDDEHTELYFSKYVRLDPFTTAEADRGLREVFTAAGLGDKAVGTNGISVPLVAGKGEHLVAHALPLSSGTRRNTGKAYKATAALFVHKATLETPAPPEVIAKTFKLTPMELRVLLGIVEVGGVPEVAEALGIAPSTVSTHLKHLFAKTGTNRQADLIKLVARFSSPLV